jgi:putative NADH-flavin reductase
MRIAVIGAAGRTGQCVIEQALSRGHLVTAVVREPEKLRLEHEHLAVARADVHDRSALTEAIAGADALISALGTGRSRHATTVYSAGVSNELVAMRTHEISRLAVISAAPAGPRTEQALLERWVAMPLLERFYGPIYADMRRMETILAASDLSWVSVRPPRLVNKPPRGGYRIDTTPLPNARTLTYADLATAILDCLDRNDLYGHAAYVAN